MKMIRTIAAAIILTTGIASADSYTRNGTQHINVVENDGLLYCTRVSDGFEMCNGMKERASGSWGGRTMKHPDMPGFMTFNGTVEFAETQLKIKGCAVGICDSEVWARQ